MSTIVGFSQTKTGAVIVLDGENFRVAPMCHVDHHFVLGNEEYLTCSECHGRYDSEKILRARAVYRASFPWDDIKAAVDVSKCVQEWVATWLGVEMPQVTVIVLNP